MHLPSHVQKRLEREHSGRLRLRWSGAKGEWHLEQRVDRATMPERIIDPWDDEAIRVRDGYSFVLAVRPGTKMPCPACGFSIGVPIMHFGTATCDYCRSKGRRHEWPAAYFPLDGESFWEHLRKIDPYNDGVRRQLRDIKAGEVKRAEALERNRRNVVESAIKDVFPMIIPSVGYTGKEKAWSASSGSG